MTRGRGNRRLDSNGWSTCSILRRTDSALDSEMADGVEGRTITATSCPACNRRRRIKRPNSPVAPVNNMAGLDTLAVGLASDYIANCWGS